MSTLRDELTRASDLFTVQHADDGLTLHPKPGKDAEFSEFVRGIMNRTHECAAFPRIGSDGRYDSVHIIC